MTYTQIQQEIIDKAKICKEKIENFEVDISTIINKEHSDLVPQAIGDRFQGLMYELEHAHELSEDELYNTSKNFVDWYNAALSRGCIKPGSNVFSNLNDAIEKNKKLETELTEKNTLINSLYQEIGTLKGKLEIYERDHQYINEGDISES